MASQNSHAAAKRWSAPVSQYLQSRMTVNPWSDDSNTTQSYRNVIADPYAKNADEAHDEID